ncbi:MAG TPA: hypothetical protein PKA31_01265 [Candidatus Moranbacteria bacterium]|nr:hypothetical protein [Candidatus Moranbacteria bacterium]
MDVTTSGTGNRTLTLTGGVFASNKNVGDLQSSLEDMLKKLRFDRVNYKWYEYDDKYNYFDLKSPKDADIVPIQ